MSLIRRYKIVAIEVLGPTFECLNIISFSRHNLKCALVLILNDENNWLVADSSKWYIHD